MDTAERMSMKRNADLGKDFPWEGAMAARIGMDLECDPSPLAKLGPRNYPNISHAPRSFKQLKPVGSSLGTNDRNGDDAGSGLNRWATEQPLFGHKPLVLPGRGVEKRRQFIRVDLTLGETVDANSEAMNRWFEVGQRPS